MAAAAASNVDRTDAQPQPATILLVEDDVLLRLWFADELRRAGFLVIEARSADEAMDLLDSGADLDLVMTDIQMPGRMDGVRLAEIVRDRWPELKVIVASGASDPRAPGVADAVFAKPLDPRQVIARINQLLGEAK